MFAPSHPARALCLTGLLLAAAAGPPPALAQAIDIRTVPISQAHQFDLFPSARLSMGGVSLAVDDSLHDPFSNPAKAARLGYSSFFGSPGVYSVSRGAGGGRSLPVGAWLRSGRWFGGASLALQQIDLSDNANPFPPPVILELDCATCTGTHGQSLQLPAADRSPGNAFGYAMVGVALPRGLSLAGSLLWAGLHGVDGVDLLYANSVRLRQRGHAVDLRLGALKDWGDGRSLSAVVLHSRFGSTHDVFYLDPIWDPGSQQIQQRPRLEENFDRTRNWGLHLEYSHPLPAPGWRLGWVATTNLMSHPKLPNYEIQNIPRDPGNSEAFNLGIGVSRSVQASLFAFDLIFEPIWSYTWADAAAPLQTAAGTTIPAGGKTIENHFRFTNARVRMGFGQDIPLADPAKAVGLQLGLAVQRIGYSLAQHDNVQLTSRSLQEDWIEWTPTWGLSLRFPAWEVRYRGSVTNGTGRPGVLGDGGGVVTADAAPRSPILVAPSGPLTLTRVRVMTHQVSLSFPFR